MEMIIGFTGALLYLIAYFLLSIKRLRADSLSYQLMNILGGVFLVINSLHQQDYPSIFTNALWAIIGLFSIFYNREKKSV